MAESIKLGVDTQAAEKELADLAKSLNQFLAEKGRAAGKQVNLLDVSKDLAALQELKKQFQELINLSKQPGGVGHIIGLANGAARPSIPSQINMAGVASSGKEQAAFMEKVLTRLLTHHLSHSANPISTNLTATELAGRRAGRGADIDSPSPAQPIHPKQPDTLSGGVNNAARHLAGQVLAGSGNGAAGAGVAGAARGLAGMLPGGVVGGGLIGLAGYALFKGVGSAMEGVERAKGEAVEIDRFKKLLGGVGVDFENLRDHIRDSAEGMGLSFEQAGKMAQVFGQTADTRSKDVAAMGGEVGNAAAVARATGMDPETVTRFFGEMRAAKVTGDLGDSKRMSLMIADAIKRSGGSINADRMLMAMSTFAERTKEQSLGPVNVAGYGGLLAGLIGGGLKAGTASGMLGSLDASLKNPQSEMMDAFVHEAIGGRGLGYGNAMRLKQAGMFASTQSVFGDQNSPFFDPGMKGLSGQTTVDKFMSHLNKSFPGQDGMSKDAKEAALAQFFGGNFAHARQFSTTYAKYGSKGLTDSTDMLKKMGLKPEDMNMPGMMQIMEIAGAGDDAGKLDKVRLGMLGRKDISGPQAEMLKGAAGKEPEAMRRAMVDIAKTLDAEKTDGQALNDYAKSMDNNLQLIGTKAIPAIEMTNSLLGALVDALAPNTPMGRERAALAHEATVTKQLSAEPASLTSRAMEHQRNKDLLYPSRLIDRKHGFPEGTMASIFEQESSWNPNTFSLDKNEKRIPGNTSHGLGQINDGTWAESVPAFRAEFGRDPVRSSPSDQMAMSGYVLARKRMVAGGDMDRGIMGYHGSTDQAVNQTYLSAIKKGVGKYGAIPDAQIRPMPQGRPVQTPMGNPQKAAEQASATMGITVGGSVQAQLRLIDQQMQDRGSVVINAPVSGKSVPSGARR